VLGRAFSVAPGAVMEQQGRCRLCLREGRGAEQRPHAAAGGKGALQGVGGPVQEGRHQFRKNWGREGKTPKSVYEFLLSVDLPIKGQPFPAWKPSPFGSYQSNLLSWHGGGRSLRLPGPLLTLPTPPVLLGSEWLKESQRMACC